MQSKCVALTIAGSDSGGGAGIQADLKTFSALGVYGASVITAITAQNLDGVTAIQAIDADVVKEQMIAVLEGYPVKGAKTGMLFSKEIVEVVAEIYSNYRTIPLVIDPVFAATSGSTLIQDSAIMALTDKLFPLAAAITPNIPEAEFLTGDKIATIDDLKKAAEKLLYMYKRPVIAKGGHLTETAYDVLIDEAGMEIYEREMVRDVNNHGSGCTFSAALAAEMAKGGSLREALRIAKDYLFRGLKDSHSLMGAVRVIDHFWRWK
jgi:hydroxymethylpyrimidine/phosphomethylpyrimidine kinase